METSSPSGVISDHAFLSILPSFWHRPQSHTWSTVFHPLGCRESCCCHGLCGYSWVLRSLNSCETCRNFKPVSIHLSISGHWHHRQPSFLQWPGLHATICSELKPKYSEHTTLWSAQLKLSYLISTHKPYPHISNSSLPFTQYSRALFSSRYAEYKQDLCLPFPHPQNAQAYRALL